MEQWFDLVWAFITVAIALIWGVSLILAVARLGGRRAVDARLPGGRLVGQWGRVVRSIPHAGVGLVRVAGVRVTTSLPARAHDEVAIVQGEQVVVVDVRGGVLEVAASADRLLCSL